MQQDTEEYDLILMDIQMPGMDGYETTRQIRKAGITIPIVALSAHASSQASQASLDAGMNDYLSKPIQMEKLNVTLSKFLGLNSLSAEFPFSLIEDKKQQLEESHSEVENPAAFDVIESLNRLTIVDLDEVMIRLNNNTDLLTRLLSTFYQSYKDFFQQIQTEFELSHYTETADLAHKLKGASRSLSLFEIAQQSEALELTLKDANYDVQEILNDLESALEQAIKELEDFIYKAGTL